MIMAAGYAWRFFNPGGLDRQQVRHTLSATVLYFFMPALAFGLLATTSIDRSFLLIPLVAISAVVLCTATGFAVYRLVPWFRSVPRSAFGVMMLAATYGNITYLGLPIITEVLGAKNAYVAILYDLLAHSPLLLTFGAFISTRYGSGKTPSVSASLKRVVALPPLWGVIAGIAVNLGGVTLPRVLLDTTALMGKAVIPIMTFTVGLALDFRDMKRLPLAAPALAIKLLLSPIFAWRVGSWLGLTGDILKAVTIEGAMPVMVVSLVLADELELDVPLAASCIAFSTAALFFTMPLMMRVLF
jgi:malate permease and related proteins